MSRKGVRFPGEDIADRGGVGVLRRRPSDRRAWPALVLHRPEFTSNTSHRTVFNLDHVCRAGRGQLIHAVMAVHDPGVLGPELFNTCASGSTQSARTRRRPAASRAPDWRSAPAR